MRLKRRRPRIRGTVFDPSSIQEGVLLPAALLRSTCGCSPSDFIPHARCWRTDPPLSGEAVTPEHQFPYCRDAPATHQGKQR